MTVSREIDGKMRHFQLNYFNGGIGLQNYSEGIIIQPNYDYWVRVIGERPVEELGWPWVQQNEDRLTFFQNHWAKASLFNDVCDVCEEFGIDVEHADNIVIPLLDFEMTDKSLIGNDIKNVAQQVESLKNLFITLEDRYNHLLSITFETGRLYDMDENGEHLYKDQKRIRIKNPRALDPVTDAIKRLVKTDVELNRHIFYSGYTQYLQFSLPKYYRERQNEMATILFEYLRNHGVCKTERDGYAKTGLFLSILNNKYVLGRELFNADEKKRIEYSTFENYLADLIGKRISRFLKSRTENSEN